MKGGRAGLLFLVQKSREMRSQLEVTFEEGTLSRNHILLPELTSVLQVAIHICQISLFPIGSAQNNLILNNL